MEQEQIFTCPYCGEEISTSIDTSVDHGQYVEDCEVCCNPIEMSYETKNGEITSFEARKTDE